MSGNDLILASLASIHAKLDSLQEQLEQLTEERGREILAVDAVVSDWPDPPFYRAVFPDGTEATV